VGKKIIKKSLFLSKDNIYTNFFSGNLTTKQTSKRTKNSCFYFSFGQSDARRLTPLNKKLNRRLERLHTRSASEHTGVIFLRRNNSSKKLKSRRGYA